MGGRMKLMNSMQAYSPFNGKKYETLSYLPQLTNEDIRKQIEYMIRNKWTPCLEMSDDGDIYLNTRMGPCYYDNRYWSMYKLPMFGCTNSADGKNRRGINSENTIVCDENDSYSRNR